MKLWSSLALVVLVGTAAPAAGQGAVNEHGNPMKLAPRATTGAITAADLQTRIYIFADDSMQGRQTGRVGNMKGTAYIARELQRIGLEIAEALATAPTKPRRSVLLVWHTGPVRWSDHVAGLPEHLRPERPRKLRAAQHPDRFLRHRAASGLSSGDGRAAVHRLSALHGGHPLRARPGGGDREPRSEADGGPSWRELSALELECGSEHVV